MTMGDLFAALGSSKIVPVLPERVVDLDPATCDDPGLIQQNAIYTCENRQVGALRYSDGGPSELCA